MVSNHAKGLAAEQAVEAHLAALGHKLIARRYKCRSGEIDLITQTGEYLVFTEVKARADLPTALASITPRAQARIREAALWFLAKHPTLAQTDPAMRFDVAAVLDDGRISLLENAF